jgi:hypothetical protein
MLVADGTATVLVNGICAQKLSEVSPSAGGLPHVAETTFHWLVCGSRSQSHLRRTISEACESHAEMMAPCQPTGRICASTHGKQLLVAASRQVAM